MSRSKLFFLFSLLTTHSLFSQIGGSTAYAFLNLPFSARESAAGGNLITVKDDDINLTFHNPSLITPAMDNNLAYSNVRYIADISYGYAAYSKSFSNIGNFVAGIQYVDYGKFTEADPTGAITGNFTAADYSFNIGYSRQLDSMFSVGATLKTIYSNLDQYTSIGSSLDIGSTYYNPKYLFTASAVIVGLAGYQWKTYSGGDQEPLPFDIQLGVSKKVKKAPFRFSLVGQHLQKWDLTYNDPADPILTVDPLTETPIKQKPLNIFGDKLARHLIGSVEILFGKSFSILLGYNYERRKELQVVNVGGLEGFSIGGCIRIYKFNMSISYAEYSIAGASTTFSVTSNLSEFYKKQ